MSCFATNVTLCDCEPCREARHRESRLALERLREMALRVGQAAKPQPELSYAQRRGLVEPAALILAQCGLPFGSEMHAAIANGVFSKHFDDLRRLRPEVDLRLTAAAAAAVYLGLALSRKVCDQANGTLSQRDPLCAAAIADVLASTTPPMPSAEPVR